MSAALAGKVALITGAARGIGRATALKLARAGCDIAANYYNSADQAETLCAEVRALGRRAIAIAGSVGVPDSVDEIVAEFGKHFDRRQRRRKSSASAAEWHGNLGWFRTAKSEDRAVGQAPRRIRGLVR